MSGIFAAHEKMHSNSSLKRNVGTNVGINVGINIGVNAIRELQT